MSDFEMTIFATKHATGLFFLCCLCWLFGSLESYFWINAVISKKTKQNKIKLYRCFWGLNPLFSMQQGYHFEYFHFLWTKVIYSKVWLYLLFQVFILSFIKTSKISSTLACLVAVYNYFEIRHLEDKEWLPN